MWQLQRDVKRSHEILAEEVIITTLSFRLSIQQVENFKSVYDQKLSKLEALLNVKSEASSPSQS